MIIQRMGHFIYGPAAADEMWTFQYPAGRAQPHMPLFFITEINYRYLWHFGAPPRDANKWPVANNRDGRTEIMHAWRDLAEMVATEVGT